MYSFDSRIRYSETDSEGKLTIENLIDYFQDCSTFQSEDLGVGFRYLRKQNLVWVLSFWQIEVDRLPGLCEHVTIGTFPYEFKGFFGYRNFFMQDEAGNYIARANSMWTLLNTENFKPMRPAEEMLEKYPLEEKLPMEYAGRKVVVPESGSFQEEIVVRPQHLDTNHHVNNGQYVRMALDVLPEGLEISKLRVEYKKQAFLHDVLRPYVACTQGEKGDTYVVSLQGTDGSVYVNVEFEGKKKMLKLGERQILKLVKKVEFGVYLADATDTEERVLLPKKQVPADAEVGSDIDVFVYRDSKDRMIATVKEPLLKMGEVTRLKVAEVNKYGAFLDWGLEKDLFLPFKQQTAKVYPGDRPLVSLYIDKSGRLCATMNVYPYLSTESPYQKDDKVSGCVYETSPEFGAFVAVDDKYSALIPKKELYGDVRIGDMVTARVTAVKEDGKLDLSIREKAYLQIQADAERVMQVIDSFDGALPFNDKASPEVIKREMQMSKNEFKRAVGHLLKEGRIEIKEKAIRKL